MKKRNEGYSDKNSRGNKISRRKKQQRAVCLTVSAVMVMGLTGCGTAETVQGQESVITQENQEDILHGVLDAQISASHSSQTGKEETVYVFADSAGSTDQVIVSSWLKNGDGSHDLKDYSELKDIQNVKGYEAFEQDGDGNIVWKTEGEDIYYRGSTDKEVPVAVKVSYRLDGKEISPEELAGKSGRVTIRLDYENRENRTVSVGGKEQEIKVPFAMISGMILPQDTFSNIEVTNARLLSEGNNSIVVGVAFPGLKESIDVEGLKDKIEDERQREEAQELEIPEYIEVEADTENFALGMTMTVAMSDILSDIELRDSFDLSKLNDSMADLQDASDQLKEGTVELKDGSGQLKDGTGELLAGADELWNGTAELKDGTQELYEKSGLLNDGAGKLNDGASKLHDGAAALYDGTSTLHDGAVRLASGAGELQNGGKKLADGTDSLLNGTKSLNDGAQQIRDGVGQVAVQMGTLKDGIGTPVTDAAAINPANPETLLQISYLLNQSVKGLSQADGLSEAYYNGILDALQQQKAQTEADRDAAGSSLAAAQERTAAAQAELTAACQGSTQEIEVVTDRHTEVESCTVEVEAPVYTTTRVVTSQTTEEGETEEAVDETTDTDTQTFTGTGEVEKEVVDTDTVQVQSVNTELVQEKIDAYQAALLDEAACRAQAEACSMRLAALEEEVSRAQDLQAQQSALMAKWAPAITYAAVMDQKLSEIAGILNSQENTMKIAALVKGAGDLADGTQDAYAGVKELSSGANALKKGIDTLNSGANELAGGAGTLQDGAAALRDGTTELRDGTAELRDGTIQLVEGTGTLNDGAGTLRDGVNTLRDGAVTLDEGMSDLDEGALALLDGMFTFDEEGISKLTELFGDDVEDVLDRLKAVADAGREYNTFTGLPEDTEGSVKFIIKTEAVE